MISELFKGTKEMVEKNESYVSNNPKTNITLETALIDEVKEFINRKREDDATYPHRTPTALIREAVRSYIFPVDPSEKAVSPDHFDDLLKRVNAIEKSKEVTAQKEQEIYIRCVAMLITLFDKKLDFFDSFKIASDNLAESNITPKEFRDFSRKDIEKYYLDHIKNPPEEFKEINSQPLFAMLMMFLFLCNLGFTRKQDIIDPMAPMSQLFLESLKKMIKKS